MLNIPKSECPDVWIRLPRQTWAKSWASIEDPVVNLHGHPLVGSLWERQFEKVLLELGWEKIPSWECLFVHRKQGLFLSVHVDDIKMAGQKQNMAPMWKKLMKNVDIGEPTSFVDHVFLGCTQHECKSNEKIIEQLFLKKSLNHVFLLEQLKNYHGGKKPHAKTVAWSYDMEGHARKCVERYCELANKRVEQFFKVSSLCLDDHPFKKEELESVGEFSEVCSQIVLKCLYLARIGRPDIPWLVNKLAKSVTKWTQACDRRLARADFLHSSHERFPTILSCVKHGTALLIGFIPRLRLCWP